MSDYQNNSIFWVEVEKISANPYQPRREFELKSLEDLADSIRQYGVLQPLVVTRKEEQSENGGISVFYELIAGERRLRAARLAGLEQVPVIIRKDSDDKIKLELAIIENLQREDLNPIDRAFAFEQLYKDFGLTHAEIGKKMGKSRVYVSNTLRLLSLPDDIKRGLMEGKITEGHTRPLLMLSDRPEEQETLYKEITLKKMSVRESEKIARGIAQDKVRKKKFVKDPRIRIFEKKLSDNLGTRVSIEQKENGGQITIDYFTVTDLEKILNSIKKVDNNHRTMLDNYLNAEEDRYNQEKEISKSNPIIFSQDKTKDNNFSQIQETDNFIENSNSLQEYHKELPSFIDDNNMTIQKYHEELPDFHKNDKEEISIYNQNTTNINRGYENQEIQQKEFNNFNSKKSEDDHIKWNSSYDNQQYDDNFMYYENEYSRAQQEGNLQEYQHEYQQNNNVNQNKRKGFINRIFN